MAESRKGQAHGDNVLGDVADHHHLGWIGWKEYRTHDGLINDSTDYECNSSKYWNRCSSQGTCCASLEMALESQAAYVVGMV